MPGTPGAPSLPARRRRDVLAPRGCAAPASDWDAHHKDGPRPRRVPLPTHAFTATTTGSVTSRRGLPAHPRAIPGRRDVHAARAPAAPPRGCRTRRCAAFNPPSPRRTPSCATPPGRGASRCRPAVASLGAGARGREPHPARTPVSARVRPKQSRCSDWRTWCGHGPSSSGTGHRQSGTDPDGDREHPVRRSARGHPERRPGRHAGPLDRSGGPGFLRDPRRRRRPRAWSRLAHADGPAPSPSTSRR